MFINKLQALWLARYSSVLTQILLAWTLSQPRAPFLASEFCPSLLCSMCVLYSFGDLLKVNLPGSSLPLFPSPSLCPWDLLAGIGNSAFLLLLPSYWLISTLLTRGNGAQSLHIIDIGDDPEIITMPVSRLQPELGTEISI